MGMQSRYGHDEAVTLAGFVIGLALELSGLD